MSTLFDLFLIFLCIIGLIFFIKCCWCEVIFWLILFVCLGYCILCHFITSWPRNLCFVCKLFLHRNFLRDRNRLRTFAVKTFHIYVRFWCLRNIDCLINFASLFLMLDIEKYCFGLVFDMRLVLSVWWLRFNLILALY